jgi:hypothetical protein
METTAWRLPAAFARANGTRRTGARLAAGLLVGGVLLAGASIADRGMSTDTRSPHAAAAGAAALSKSEYVRRANAICNVAQRQARSGRIADGGTAELARRAGILRTERAALAALVPGSGEAPTPAAASTSSADVTRAAMGELAMTAVARAPFLRKYGLTACAR